MSFMRQDRDVARLTGLGKNTVKEIDKKRLEGRFTQLDGEGRRVLKKPEVQARHLGVDEFKLHDGNVFATIIIDLDRGSVLWLAHGKRKQAVYDFIDHVGEQWMDGVEAVACDMNSDFQEAFEERCPHIQVVFDYFHIKKNLNEKVINEIKKDEVRRLIAEGRAEEAASLKRTKYILCSSRETLASKDKKAAETESSSRDAGPGLFEGGERKVFHGGNMERYENLIGSNKLLFTVDLVNSSSPMPTR